MAQHSEIDAQHIGTFWMLKFERPSPADLAQPHYASLARIPATFTRVGPEVAQELARVMELDDPAVILQRFAAGRHCYVARVAGQLVTYGWVTFDEENIGELGLSIRLKAGEAYIWDCATVPAFRGQRLYPALLTHILRALQAEGLQRVWIGTNRDNLASQIGIVAAGFQPVADFLIVNAPSKREVRLRGRTGVSKQDLEDVQHALSGNRDH
jgi:ribosomal protein S18 acetylase RimI-like enzyme